VASLVWGGAAPGKYCAFQLPVTGLVWGGVFTGQYCACPAPCDQSGPWRIQIINLLSLLLQEDQTDEEIDLTESANTGGNREEYTNFYLLNFSIESKQLTFCVESLFLYHR
jgi:hypothetical protein